MEKLKRRKKDKSRLTDLDSDEDLDPSEEGTREELLRRRAAQRTSTSRSRVRERVSGSSMIHDDDPGQLMAPPLQRQSSADTSRSSLGRAEAGQDWRR